MSVRNAPSDLDYADPFGNDTGERTVPEPSDDLSDTQRALLLIQWQRSGTTLPFNIWRLSLSITELLKISLDITKEKNVRVDGCTGSESTGPDRSAA